MGSRLIDTSGDVPRLRLAALATTLVGIVSWGYVEGLLSFIGRAGDGVSGALYGLALWIEHDLVGGIVSIATSTMTAGFGANIAWLRTLGAIGLVVGLVEALVVGYVVLWTLSTIVSIATEAI